MKLMGILALVIVGWLTSGAVIGVLYYREQMQSARDNGAGNVNGMLGVWVGAVFGAIINTFLGPIAVALWLMG
jgi:hypothetical protein